MEITGQVLLFFFAGFESVSTALCCVAYELAINPDIQRTLQDEIDQVCNEQDNVGEKHLNYEKLHRLKFLDMVISGNSSSLYVIMCHIRHTSSLYRYFDSLIITLTTITNTIIIY